MRNLSLLCTLAFAIILTSCQEKSQVLIPTIDGDWWQVAGDPDIGEYTSPKQQPVDFGVWQAADGTWQLWSCIRHTNCGGNTRLFFRWEGESLDYPDWKPMGIAMEADTALGETNSTSSMQGIRICQKPEGALTCRVNHDIFPEHTWDPKVYK